jgi:hypothetical protein
MTKEALKLALEALEEHHYGVAQIIIREALAQPEQEQQPWCMKMNGCETKCEDCPDKLAQPEQERPQNCGTGYCSCVECVMEPKPDTSPPQRTWVEVEQIKWEGDKLFAKLKELNHG